MVLEYRVRNAKDKYAVSTLLKLFRYLGTPERHSANGHRSDRQKKCFQPEAYRGDNDILCLLQGLYRPRYSPANRYTERQGDHSLSLCMWAADRSIFDRRHIVVNFHRPEYIRNDIRSLPPSYTRC